jgi:hypothetical protein
MGMAPGIQRMNARRSAGRRLPAPTSNSTFVFHNSTLFTKGTRPRFPDNDVFGLGLTLNGGRARASAGCAPDESGIDLQENEGDASARVSMRKDQPDGCAR